MTTPLTEQAAAYAVDRATTPAAYTDLQRAFMAGCLAALTTKAPYQSMLAECVQYGRTIGTSSERA